MLSVQIVATPLHIVDKVSHSARISEEQRDLSILHHIYWQVPIETRETTRHSFLTSNIAIRQPTPIMQSENTLDRITLYRILLEKEHATLHCRQIIYTVKALKKRNTMIMEFKAFSSVATTIIGY